MAQHTSGTHYHGYVERVSLAEAKAPSGRRHELEADEIMRTADEVTAWLEGTLRAALERPDDNDGGFADERAVWMELAQQGETITTGLTAELTVTAAAVLDEDCRCEAPPLVPVPPSKKRR